VYDNLKWLSNFILKTGVCLLTNSRFWRIIRTSYTQGATQWKAKIKQSTG
jgi:hypothetical protein